MEKHPLVSVLTPSYNSGLIIHRLLDSVLMQTYPNIEMYVVDDGSTDNTEEVVNSYMEKFHSRNYRLFYIRQENSGQSVAINNGLKLVKGEYLVWPDSDDYYVSGHAIEKLVGVFETRGGDTGLVRCCCNLVDEKSLDKIGELKPIKVRAEADLFENCLFQKDFWYQPGDYMAKVSDIDFRIPGRNIYTEKRAGQNWQLMLPLLYKKKCITINEFMYNVVVRPSSHSHSTFKSFETLIAMNEVYERTILSTLDNMAFADSTELQLYKQLIRNKYILEKLNYSVKCNRKDFVRKYLSEAEEQHFSIPFKLKVKIRFPILDKMYSETKSIVKKVIRK